MNKRWLCVLMVLAMMVNVTACSDVKKEQESQETESVEQESDRSGEQEEQSQESLIPEDAEEMVAEEKPALLNIMKTSMECQRSESVNDEWNFVEARQDYFLLEKDSAKYYPNLAKSLEKLKTEYESMLAASMDSLMENFTEVVVNAGVSTNLADKTTRTVLRADDRFFSFLEQNECYLGGAHGSYLLNGIAFDVNTGERVLMADVVKDTEKLKEIVAKQLDEVYGDIFYDNIYQMIDSYEPDTFNWSMDPFGITLYFNQYELAAYAAGMQTVELTYEDYPDLLEKSYFEPQEQYILELTENGEHAYDVNNDGVKEKLTVERDVLEYDYYATTVVLNGKTIKSNVEDFDADCYLVKCKDAAYLYVFHRTENDYSVLEVFDLKTGSLVPWGDGNSNLFLASTYKGHEEQDWYYSETNSPVFVNPEEFYLSSRMDTLSTYNGTKKYCVGGHGLPVTEDAAYVVDVNFLLKAKADVPCEVWKEDGTVMDENGVLPAGTFFKIVSATKNEVWVVKANGYVPESEEYDLNYFMVNDDTTYDTDVLYHIQVDREYGDTIGGRDVWELLDGLMYAG